MLRVRAAAQRRAALLLPQQQQRRPTSVRSGALLRCSVPINQTLNTARSHLRRRAGTAFVSTRTASLSRRKEGGQSSQQMCVPADVQEELPAGFGQGKGAAFGRRLAARCARTSYTHGCRSAIVTYGTNRVVNNTAGVTIIKSYRSFFVFFFFLLPSF